jgi:hypothetical protein
MTLHIYPVYQRRFSLPARKTQLNKKTESFRNIFEKEFTSTKMYTRDRKRQEIIGRLGLLHKMVDCFAYRAKVRKIIVKKDNSVAHADESGEENPNNITFDQRFGESVYTCYREFIEELSPCDRNTLLYSSVHLLKKLTYFYVYAPAIDCSTDCPVHTLSRKCLHEYTKQYHAFIEDWLYQQTFTHASRPNIFGFCRNRLTWLKERHDSTTVKMADFVKNLNDADLFNPSVCPTYTEDDRKNRKEIEERGMMYDHIISIWDLMFEAFDHNITMSPATYYAIHLPSCN